MRASRDSASRDAGAASRVCGTQLSPQAACPVPGPGIFDLLFLSAFAFVDSRLQLARPPSIPSLLTARFLALARLDEKESPLDEAEAKTIRVHMQVTTPKKLVHTPKGTWLS
jgi:hypothetical protein